jgi:hypothetical protein
MSSSRGMVLGAEVGRRGLPRLGRRGLISAPRCELYPGLLEAVKVALANRRARRRLADANELAERGRETGVRV